MTSSEIYDKAVDIVSKLSEEESTNLDSLIVFEFQKKDLNEGVSFSTRSPNDLYTWEGNQDGRVEVNYYSYDPTKTFSPIKPDMNKFYVRLFDKKGEQIKESHFSFSDKPYSA
jgi:hypothetical protein